MRVLVVGAGIAGLTAAIALRRRGFDCELVEITAAGEPVGAAITFWGQALDALDSIGLLDDCRALGATDILRPAGFDSTGAPLARLPAAGPTSLPSIGIYRPAWSARLIERVLAAGARLRLATSVRALRQHADCVDVTFSDGRQDRFDLVIGADGIRSVVRELAFADAGIQPRRAGQLSVRWMAPGDAIPGPTMTYHAGDTKLLSFALPRQHAIYVATVANRVVPDRLDAAASRELLRGQLAAYSAPYVVELARRLRDDAIVIARNFEWLLIPPPWHRGRVLLIGDAAHATTAHLASGGCMAIEDGIVLAECLAEAASPGAALERFMARRYERVRIVVEGSAAISELEQQGAPPTVTDARRAEAFRQLAAHY